MKHSKSVSPNDCYYSVNSPLGGYVLPPFMLPTDIAWGICGYTLWNYSMYECIFEVICLKYSRQEDNKVWDRHKTVAKLHNTWPLWQGKWCISLCIELHNQLWLKWYQHVHASRDINPKQILIFLCIFLSPWVIVTLFHILQHLHK